MRKNSIFSSCKTLLHAFSLVELMISLITISLITAAFAPVITKKLSAGTITVGSFGGGSGGGNAETQWGEPRSQADCDPYNAFFISKEINGGESNICATKYNVGDAGGPSLAPSVQILSVGSLNCTSPDARNCCWQGKTSENCLASDNYGSSYSGCNRTVCQFNAAKASCENWSTKLNGLEVDGWRLPKKSELAAWMQNIKNNPNTDSIVKGLGNNGLQLCMSNSDTGSTTRCNASVTGVCGANERKECYPYCLFPDEYLQDLNIFIFHTESDIYVGVGGGGINQALSARCVTDNVPYPETIGSGSGGGSSVDINSLKKNMCGMFDTKYWDESEKSCKTCSDDIPNCEKCSNGTTCEKCASGYQLVDGKCSATKCPRATMQIGDLCVTQYNIGDHDNYRLPNANSVDYLLGVYNAGSGDSACSADYTTGCCWRGATSGTDCDSANGSYSGCNRTVCNWYAADNLCKNISIEGFSGWRLPTIDELTSFNPDTYSKSNSPNPGDNGLMFCDAYSGYNSARCSYVQVCPGSYDNNCYPFDLWSGTLHNSTNAFLGYLTKTWGNGSGSYSRTYAFSTRCVIDMCKLNYQNCQTCTNEGCSLCNDGYYLTNGYCKKLTTVPNCLSYSSTEDKCTACNAGYGYSDGTCTACTSGTYSAGGTMACTSSTTVSNCATYSTTSDVCTACNSGYNLTSGNCVASCVCSNGSCGSGSSVCTTCNAKYYLSNGSCAICPAGYYCTGGTADKIACSTLGKMYHAAEGQSSCGNCATEAGGIYSSSIDYPVCTGVNHTLSYCTCLGCVSGYYLLNGLCFASH